MDQFGLVWIGYSNEATNKFLTSYLKVQDNHGADLSICSLNLSGILSILVPALKGKLFFSSANRNSINFSVEAYKNPLKNANRLCNHLRVISFNDNGLSTLQSTLQRSCFSADTYCLH